MPTDYALIKELQQATGEPFLPLPPEWEEQDFGCYVDDCRELAVVMVLVVEYGEYIQKCEGHARLHYDKEYQTLRLKWRRAGWGE